MGGILDYVPDVAELASSRGTGDELVTQKVRKGLYALVGISRGCTIKTLVNNLKPRISLSVQSEVFNLAGVAVSELSGKPIPDKVLESFGVTREQAYADEFTDIGEKPLSSLALKTKRTYKRLTLEQKRYILQKHSEGQSQADTSRFLDIAANTCSVFLRGIYGDDTMHMNGKKIPPDVLKAYFPVVDPDDVETIRVVLQAFSKGSSPESIDCTAGLFKGHSQAILSKVYGENWRTKSCMLVPKKVCDEFNIPYPELRTTAPELPKPAPEPVTPITNLVKSMVVASNRKFSAKVEEHEEDPKEEPKTNDTLDDLGLGESEKEPVRVLKAYKVSLLCPTAEDTIELNFVTKATTKAAAIMKVLRQSLCLAVEELNDEDVIQVK